MPNRIIRDGILTSPKMAKLSWAEEVFFRRLMSLVDDYGRYYAAPDLLRGHCYPRQLNKVSDSDVGKWLDGVQAAGLVRVYPAKDGESYLEIINFGQQIRAQKSKFPQPTSPDEQLKSIDSKCLQTTANEHLDVSVFVSEDVSVSAGSPLRFEEFWKAWPKSERKQDKAKCAAKWKAAKLDSLTDSILSDIATKKKTQKWQGGFIEAPEVYLNNRRWEDGVTPDQPGTGAMVDPDSRAAIEADGVAKGIGPWDESKEQWHFYKARVRGPVSKALTLDQLQKISQQKEAA